MKFPRTNARSLRLMLAAGCALAALPLARTIAETQVAGAPAYSPVTDARLANAAHRPRLADVPARLHQLRLLAAGPHFGQQRHQLKHVWDFKSAFQQGHESAAVVNGDTLFITTPKDEVHAFQASTGKRALDLQARPSPGRPEDRVLRRGQPRRRPLRRAMSTSRRSTTTSSR